MLAQRNALLKKSHYREDQLFVGDIKLSELGAQIVRERLLLLTELESSVPAIYSDLASKPHAIKLFYLTKTNTTDYANSLLSGLRSSLAIDKERGFTSLGPHRDDGGFSIDGRHASL